MTYHFIGAPGIGEYTGYNTGPVGAEIVRRGGATDSSSLKAYAAAGAGAGGAALCTAYGAAAAAPLCASIASTVVGTLLSVGKATAGPGCYSIAHYWNNNALPRVRAAAEGQLAIRSYLAMRDQAIDEAAKAGADKKWADKWLSEHGIPGAPIIPEWSPRQDLYETYKAMAIWSEHPVGADPVAKAQGYTHGSGINRCATNYLSGQSCGPSAQSVADQLGRKCPEFLLTAYHYPFGSPAAPGEPINWAMVGAYQAVQTLPGQAKSGQWWPDVCLPMPNMFAGQGSRPINSTTPGYSAPQGEDVCKAQPKVNAAKWTTFAKVIPTQLAAELRFKLQDSKPQLLADAKKLGVLSSRLVLVRAEPRKGKSSALAIAAVGIAGLGAGGWWWWKRRR